MTMASLFAPPTATPRPGAGPSAFRDHFVQFYERDDALVSEVARYVRNGLESGVDGLIIATPGHRAAIHDEWERQGFDPEPALARGKLACLDARETLDRFMRDGHADEALFEAHVGRLVQSATARFGDLLAFGEMVALLAEDGLHDEALRVEGLWNALAARARFALYCAYPMASFGDVRHGEAFRHVCAAHAYVMPAEPAPTTLSDQQQVRLVAELQQRAAALERELQVRDRLERRLAERERELADFLENGVVGLHRVAADGTILWANRAEMSMLGYEADEYIGRNITEFHADRDVLAQIMRKLASGQELREQPARMVCKDGSLRHVLIDSNGQIRDGRFVSTRCFTRDVTDRWLAQEALRERAAILHLAMEAARMGYWTFAPVHASMRVSAELKAILDLPESESSLDAFAAVMQPDDARRFSAAVGRAVAQRERVECEFRTRSGKRFEARGEAIYDAAGSVVRVYGVCIARSRPAAQ
jgi:PAS domain S-box-containing protein